MVYLEYIGDKFINWLEAIGRSFIFIINTIFGSFRIKNFITQLFFIGVKSFIIIAVSGLFIGFVLALQGYFTLAKFSATSALGPMVALSVLRELGPVVTALLFAGRVGSALTSEIGLMKATEQLSSLEIMGVNPIRYISAPRFWASLVSMPLLNIIFCSVAIFGGYLVGVKLLGLYDGTFWNNISHNVFFISDILNGIIKSIIFGFAITWIALYQGFYCKADSDGIAKATTKTVVYASLVVLALDFLLTAIMF